jgi:membrane protein required for colicin V production
MALDLVLLVALTLAAALGAAAGALRQGVQLAAAVLGWLAARHLGAAVAGGLGRWLPPLVARAAAGVLLFAGIFALASLVGGALLRGTGLATAVRGPADRGLGALLGGAKVTLVGWVALSAAALGASALPAKAVVTLSRSELASLAREHNLLLRLDPDKARTLERLLRHAMELDRQGALASDPDARRALLDPHLVPYVLSDLQDPTAAEKALEDPEVRALVERIRARAAERERAGGAPDGEAVERAR